MVDGPSDADDGGAPDEGAILSPSELDITESEHVEQLDEGRFVVSPEARTQQGKSGARGGGGQGGARGGVQGSRGGARGGGSQRGGADGGPPAQGHRSGQRGGGGHSGNISENDVHRFLRQKYERSNSNYAFDVTACFDGTVSQRRMASNDLITTFESLLLWYAQQVDTTMPVEEILGILLMESNVPVRYPPKSVHNLVKSTDLGPDDTIADLLEAVQDDDGVKL